MSVRKQSQHEARLCYSRVGSTEDSHQPWGSEAMITNPEILERDSKLAELVRRLVVAYQPECLYLFGSRGRNHGEPDSDYDLLMILPKLEAPAYRIAQQAHSLVWGLGISADILVWSREGFDRRLPFKASLPATVMREGMLLHAA